MIEHRRPPHRAAQVREPGGPVRVSQVEARRPGDGEVRVDVAACGVRGADAGTVADRSPAGGFPITPGHEVAGVIAETGRGVRGWEAGDRVAVGWFGGSCGHCAACRSGDVVHCPQRRVPGLSYAGGWSSTITVPAGALVRIPDGLSFVEAAPFGCAAVTTFNALEKPKAAADMGAHHYVDGARQAPGQAPRNWADASSSCPPPPAPRRWPGFSTAWLPTGG